MPPDLPLAVFKQSFNQESVLTNVRAVNDFIRARVKLFVTNEQTLYQLRFRDEQIPFSQTSELMIRFLTCTQLENRGVGWIFPLER